MVILQKVLESSDYIGRLEEWKNGNVWFVVRDFKGIIRCRESGKKWSHRTPRCMDMFFEREEIDGAAWRSYWLHAEG